MGKETHAFLRTVALGGDYPLPTSEESYKSNRDLFDVAIPVSGYYLQPDGTWTRDAAYENDWQSSIPILAQESGQRYTPSVGATRDNLHVILDDEDLWDIAASNLVAISEGWNGVVYDIMDTSVDRVDAHGDFVLALSTAVRQEGLWFQGSYYGITWDNPAYFPLDVAMQASDIFIYYCYAWWAQPRMVSPYWWVKASLDFALTKGVVMEKTVMGCAFYSTWWEVEGVGPRHDMTYAQAIEIAHANNARVEWMETSDFGLVREKYADTGPGYLAITDGDTLRHKLDLIDEYEMRGLMLFTPGLEDDSVWPVVDDWHTVELPYLTSRIVNPDNKERTDFQNAQPRYARWL